VCLSNSTQLCALNATGADAVVMFYNDAGEHGGSKIASEDDDDHDAMELYDYKKMKSRT
jgi:hypothetical protein